MRMDVRSADLGIEELQQARSQCANLLALMAAGVMMQAGGFVVFHAILVVLAACVHIVAPRLVRRIPKIVFRMCTIVVLLLMVFYLATSLQALLPAMLRLVSMLLGLRLIEARTQREDWQMLLLATFGVLLSGVANPDIGFAFSLAVYSPVGLVELLLLTLCRARVPSGAMPVIEWKDYTPWRLVRRILKACERRTLAAFAVLLVSLTLLSMLVFTALPRIDFGRDIPLLRNFGAASSGFSDEVKFGASTNIREDDTEVFSVDVTDAALPQSPYWRMAVLDQYFAPEPSDPGSGGFRGSPNLEITGIPPRENRVYFNWGDASEGAVSAGTWTFYVQPSFSRYLPTPGMASELRFPANAGVRMVLVPANRVSRLVETPASMFFFQYRDVRLSAVLPATSIDYPLLDRLQDGRIKKGGTPLTAKEMSGQRRRYPYSLLEFPGSEADLKSLAQVDAKVRAMPEIAGREPDGVDALSYARAATQWLGRNHAYSTASNIPRGDASLLVRWLASNEPGHCELFSGSLVVLMRHAGYPARVVNGFSGGRINEVTQSIKVTNREAHAWCEIYHDGTDGTRPGWYLVDPTIGSAGMAGADGSLPGAAGMSTDNSLKAMMDAVRIQWFRSVVNFDTATQRSFWQGLGDRWDDALKKFKAMLDDSTNKMLTWRQNPFSAEFWPWYAGCAAGLAVVVALWVRYRNRAVRARLHEALGCVIDAQREEAGWLLCEFKALAGFEGDFLARASVVRAALQEIRYGPGIPVDDARRVMREARVILPRIRRSAGK